LKETKDLIAEMDTAHDADYQILQTNKKYPNSVTTAMNRFNLLQKASSILTKKCNQLIFLEQSGCAILEKWLRQNPDGSFPPI
jgi:hypothetical protein